LEELLPVPYFHAVFTIPNELNPFALRNKRVIYDLQQQAISETFRELSEDPKYIGAKIGYIAVLHTWGQNLMDHPHIHCITPGGGITGRQKWKSSKKDFLFPIKVLSRLYKGKFMDKFQTGVKKGEIHFHGKLGIYSEFSIWKQFVNTLYDKEWVVYCKKPFSGPDQVLKYLGGYTHRIAISNHRILKVSEGMVTFTWKDYKNGGVKKLLTLKMTEFIRRFLLHVLPKGFKRIRYYGFLSNRIRSKSLSLCFSLLKKSENKARKPKQLKSACELLKQLFGIDLRICPKCGQGKLVPSFSSIKFGGGFY
jgi:hypothetical protein